MAPRGFPEIYQLILLTLWSLINPIFLCFLTGFELLTNGITSAECQDRKSAQENINIFTDMLYYKRLLWLRECPLPCKQKVYDAKVFKFHSNTLIGRDEKLTKEIRKNAVLFGIGYETFAVHENVEALVYDTGMLLSQIGGNLGLFLGVSCLSVLTGIIKLSRKFVFCGNSKLRLKKMKIRNKF